MSEVLSLEHLSITTSGPTLTMSLSAGQSMAVVGPAGSGKSSLLRIIAGQDKPPQGSLRVRGKTIVAGAAPLPRRAKIQTLARSAGDSNAATEALTATRLWELRTGAVSQLTSSQTTAAELLEPLACKAELVVIDGHLDQLDPWTLQDVLRLMRSRSMTTFVVATQQPQIVERMDALVVLKSRHVRFAGTPSDLIRNHAVHHLTVSAEKESGVRALVEPFEVSVQKTEDGLALSAGEGQELAARLLLEGYGNVRYVIDRPPTLTEALLAL